MGIHFTNMKHMINLFLLLLFLSPFGLFSSSPKLKEGSDQIKVLVVGFDKDFKSNYFTRNQIAERLEVETADLDSILNYSLLNSFMEQKTKKIQLIVPDNMKALNAARTMGFGEISLKDQHTYLLVIKDYRLDWREEPFKTLFHIFNYELHDPSNQTILSSEIYFNSFQLLDQAEYTNNMNRLAKKMINQLNHELR
jgi:hypothetical protein